MQSSTLNSRRRFTLAGFLVGLLLALGVLFWVARTSTQGSMSGEGLAMSAVSIAVVAGAPLNFAFSIVVDWMTPTIHAIPGLNVFHVLLLGVVANWTLIGWIVDRTRSK